MRMWKYGVMALVSGSVVACSSDPSAPVDRSADLGVDMPGAALDMASSEDQAVEMPDVGTLLDMLQDQGSLTRDLGAQDAGQDMNVGNEDMSDADMQDMQDMQDMSADLADMSPLDMSDMGGAYADRARGDCTMSSECGSTDLFCERGAVGGTCSGPCAACDDIPGPNTYECIAGACVPECDDDTDCPPGRTCNMRRGVCQVQRCAANVCPVPWFACSEPDGICVRQACDNGEACPAQTQCDGQYCIETHSIR